MIKLNHLWIMALMLSFASQTVGQALEVLHSFQGSNGSFPAMKIMQGNDSSFYGTTELSKTIFRITSNGELTTLYTFGSDSDSGYSSSALVQGDDGFLYGTTHFGGMNDGGALYKISTNGEWTTLVSFAITNGFRPRAELTAGDDGFLYGTTALGGANNVGTVFRIALGGKLTTLCSFAGIDGAFPYAGLTLGKDGNFYGTTMGGGVNDEGTVFKISVDGSLTTLVTFDGSNGGRPRGKLVQGINGHFYGTTERGGSNGWGTVFHIAPDGTFRSLASFSNNNADGHSPYAGLVQGNDGDFYGAGLRGGANSLGTIFKITTDGALATVVTFNGANGSEPIAGLIQARDGNLYGTTSRGGTNDLGTVYRIVMPVTLNSQVNGNQLVLSWSTNALGFTLQSAADLNSSTDWSDSTNAPAVVGAQFTVTNLISDTSRLFRLKKP